MKEVQGWQKNNNPNVPKVGEMAPDFELTDVTGTQTVRLSDFRGKRPVVLLFGSFT
jgi:peroxiredoxin